MGTYRNHKTLKPYVGTYRNQIEKLRVYGGPVRMRASPTVWGLLSLGLGFKVLGLGF